MKYDPKHLTYEDALEIEKRGLAVTAKSFEDGSTHTGPLRHMTLSDVLKSADIDTRLMMIAAITTSGLEYFYIAVREPGFNYDLPAIVFRRDGGIDDNYIIGIEGQSTSGVEINADELMDRLVKQETPTADADKTTTDTQAEEWEADLPKANGIYKAATGSVWLHSGDTWTPILNCHGNIPPSALQQSNPEFAISSHKAHRWPFEREVEKKLPTRPGFYRNKDKTSVYYLDSCGVWKLIAYMGPDFNLQMKDPYDSPLVPVFGGEVVSERRVRNDMPLHYCTLGLKQPKEAVCEANS